MQSQYSILFTQYYLKVLRFIFAYEKNIPCVNILLVVKEQSDPQFFALENRPFSSFQSSCFPTAKSPDRFNLFNPFIQNLNHFY
jgi:hypothetical protein